MRQSARWADICKLLCSCDVVGLSGTQINTSLACQQDVCHGYHRFQWGRGPGLRGKPTGCALLFKKTSFAARGFKWIYSPPDKLKGRLGAVRFHTVSMDVCFITGYAYVCDRSDRAKGECDYFWQHVYKLLDELPARCVPILLFDAIAKIGIPPGILSGIRAVSDTYIGDVQPDELDYNGSLLYDFLHHHFLSAINTYFDTGPTFFHCRGRGASRIDYIISTSAVRNSCSKCEVWMHTGAQLQLINTAMPRDHMPLIADIKVGPFFFLVRSDAGCMEA